VIFAVIILTGATLGLAQWASWLSGRYGAPRWLRTLRWVFGIAALGQLALHYWSFRHLSSVIDRNGSVDPTNKARILAEGISEAMNGIAMGILFTIPSMIVMLVLTWRYHWGAKTPKPRGEPPYR